ncbi:isoprenoid synthase domain-containing protein [Hysterangium stoloniferum]|nr:isoprenoid synthase domain-containing protein [Hysterangium stoloniferum]
MLLLIPQTTASITNSIAMDPSKQQMEMKSILQCFLSDLNHGPLNIDPTNVELEAFMRSEMESRNIQCIQLERTLHLAASMIELAYHDCSLAEKKNIALYNWYLIYVDDMSTTDPVALNEFEQRFLRGQPQLNPVLTALIETLMNMWDLYDPLSVNSIISATFEFITSNCIEPELEKTMPPVEGFQRFPWFVREKSGVAAAFTLQIFTKSKNFAMMEILKVLPDIYYWIDLTNDLLSPLNQLHSNRFHKEELAGEKGNYVHLRANAESLAPLEVLARMAEELRISRDTIHEGLVQNPSALNAWKVYEQGYVKWHMIQERYKLQDLIL